MATIFCFTSTGNSLYAAKRIAEKIGGDIVPMGKNLYKCEDDIIGFVFPVYFWRLPRIVERFITKMRIINKDAYVFAVATYGGMVYGVLGRLKSLMEEKGILLSYGQNLKMVENYIPRYKVNDQETFRQEIDENISKIIDAVKSRKSNKIQAYTFINKVISRSYPDENSDRYFTVSPACIGCGICQKVCPVGNIIIDSGKPVFQHRCEHCLACVHQCPVHAIDWKQKTQGKKRFRNAGVTLNDLISFNNTVIKS